LLDNFYDGAILDGTMSSLLLHAASVFAEHEGARKGERTRATKRAQKARGEYSGGKPQFGYARDGKRLVPIPEQQAAIRRMQRMRAKGMPLREIRNQMRASGLIISHGGVSNALRAAARKDHGIALGTVGVPAQYRPHKKDGNKKLATGETS
jgi:DNA invertase Pin-like site-specific DNA recombinase